MSKMVIPFQWKNPNRHIFLREIFHPWTIGNTVFSLASAHACNSILTSLTIWNEMDCLNRSCSADLVLCTVYTMRSRLSRKDKCRATSMGRCQGEYCVLSFFLWLKVRWIWWILVLTTRNAVVLLQGVWILCWPAVVGHFLDPPRESSPWGNFSDGGSFVVGPLGWLIDWR